MRRWLVYCFAALLLATGAAHADTGSAGLKPDVRLLIDISGSMRDSDPENLRAPALDLIVRLLPEGSKAGVWVFGEGVENVVPLRVIDKRWRAEAAAAMESIDNSGQLTNIPLAIERATTDLRNMDPGFRTSIILLTDGKVDVSESPTANARASRILLEEVAPLLQETGIPVHTIALSDEADWKFLRRMARTTGGIAEVAQEPEKLTEIFLQALEMVAPTEQVPMDGSRFVIDETVREFSTLVFFEGQHDELRLRAPGGELFSAAESPEGIQWFNNRKFSLVTAADPAAGEWELQAPGLTNARVTVIADLKLEVDPLPTSLPWGQAAELGIRLTESGVVITDPEVLSAFSISVSIGGPKDFATVLDVSGTYSVPADGEYRVRLEDPPRSGRYDIRVRVDGQTFQREIPMYMQVQPQPEVAQVSTRAQMPEDVDFDVYLPTAIGVALLLLIVWLVVQYRRRQRMAEWRQRYENSRAEGEDSELSGLRADRNERA